MKIQGALNKLMAMSILIGNLSACGVGNENLSDTERDTLVGENWIPCLITKIESPENSQNISMVSSEEFATNQGSNMVWMNSVEAEMKIYRFINVVDRSKIESNVTPPLGFTVTDKIGCSIEPATGGNSSTKDESIYSILSFTELQFCKMVSKEAEKGFYCEAAKTYLMDDTNSQGKMHIKLNPPPTKLPDEG